MEDKMYKEKRIIGVSLGILVIISNLAMYFLIWIIAKLNIKVDESNLVLISYIFNAISIYIVGFLILKLILKLTNKGSSKKLKEQDKADESNEIKYEKRKLKIPELLLLICFTYGVSYITSFIIEFIKIFIKIVFHFELNDPVQTMLSNSSLPLVLIFVVIIGPIFEELIFRGTFLKKIRKWGDLTAIIYSSIAFGLFHCNFSQIPFAIMAGFVLGYSYTKSNNIVYPIILHMLLNLMSAIALTASIMDLKILSIIQVLIIFIMIILTIIFIPISFVNGWIKFDNKTKLSKKKLYFNIGYIFSVIVVLIISVMNCIK